MIAMDAFRPPADIPMTMISWFDFGTPSVKPLVAIVNDDEAIIAMLSDLLADEGYQAFSCLSGDEAHKAIRREKPHSRDP